MFFTGVQGVEGGYARKNSKRILAGRLPRRYAPRNDDKLAFRVIAKASVAISSVYGELL